MTRKDSAAHFSHMLYLHRQEIVNLHRESVKAFFSMRFPRLTVSLTDGSTNHLANTVDCLIAPADQWIESIVQRLPSLRWIHFTGSGSDSAHDLLRSRPDLIASKSSTATAPAMAEFAVAAMLYFGKGLDQFAKQQRRREWKRHWLTELSGHHLVILGAGAVAEALGQRAKGLGLQVTAVGRTGGRRKSLRKVATMERLPVLLRRADFVVCCLPLTSKTRGLLGKAEFQAMPPHAVFVNIARGGIVDEAALLEALQEGWIRGAAVDVFEEEPLPKTSPLWRCPSLLITPHVAGTTDKYLSRVLQSFECNWHSLHTTGRLATPVDLAREY